jgi:GDP-4-dehydro-6-deoxy-D-mannose reductase
VRALITGGAGFVGRWLAEHLRAEGDEVVVSDHETDVTDAAAIADALEAADPDAVYHLAALTHVGESWAAPTEVLRVNVIGTAEVLAAARRLVRPPVVLLASSAEVYGLVTPDDLPLTESAPAAPVTPYAASKLAAEEVALQAWRGHGQPVVVARAFNHIGPGQAARFAVSGLAHRILEAQHAGSTTLAVGTLESRRDFTDVRDVVRAYRLLVTSGRAGSRYNVCSGRDRSITEIAARLLELSGARLTFALDPDLVRPVDLPVLRGSPDALEAATGWLPEIPLDVTLRDVLDDVERRLEAPVDSATTRTPR